MASTTRRRLFGAALALSTAPAAMAVASTASAAALEAEYDRQVGIIRDPRTADEPFEAACNVRDRLEDMILATPCRDAQMARTKLKMVAERLRSEPSPWADEGEQRGVEQVLAWLETR